MSEARKRIFGSALCALAVALLAWMAFSVAPKAPEAETYTASGRGYTVTAIDRSSGGTISVNLAELEDLLELPGVGETLATAILTEREAHGWYYYPEDLMAAKGIGKAKLEGFREALDLTVPEE